MIKLKQLYLQILKEQIPGSQPNQQLQQPIQQQPQQSLPLSQPQQQDDNVFELPNFNIAVSQFPAQKKMTLSALDKEKPAHKIRQLVNQLKNEFNVKNVSQKSTDMFEVTLDEREDYWSVIDYLKNAK